MYVKYLRQNLYYEIKMKKQLTVPITFRLKVLGVLVLGHQFLEKKLISFLCSS